MRRKMLRSGYTTGACAAAAAKAATILLLRAASELPSSKDSKVEIPFPDGSRVSFKIHNSELVTRNSKLAWASVIKDAGDDPDVTNGVEICATVRLLESPESLRLSSSAPLPQKIKDFWGGNSSDSATELIIKGGKGVGIVTKPGLPVPVGEPAINPVPRKMIKEAVIEALQHFHPTPLPQKIKDFWGTPFSTVTPKNQRFLGNPIQPFEITISVPDGENLAKKTLNARLGIIGGISILGTTGIVKPISSEAWTATITLSMDVAKAMGNDEIVLSAGRASEKAHMKKYNFPEESYVMMGDYLEFSLLEAKRLGFKKIHICAQWAKMLKIAMATPQTHVRYGVIDAKKIAVFLESLLNLKPSTLTHEPFNTAREIFDYINASALTVTFTTNSPQPIEGESNNSAFLKVCSAAKVYTEKIASGIPVVAHLVSYEGEIIASSE